VALQNPLTHSFVPIVLMVAMSALTGVGVLVLSWLAGGGSKRSSAGDTIYECGLDPMDAPSKRFPVKFYVVAMLFILFDVEIALLYPWAVYFGKVAQTPALRMFAFVDLLVFAAILVAGYAYLYRAGALDVGKASRQVSEKVLASLRGRSAA
jgi:NADH-quinone oxidoreductase subunit A